VGRINAGYLSEESGRFLKKQRKNFFDTGWALRR
jgi:hypothetical protein